MSSIISGTKYRGEFEEKLQNIINMFIKNKNNILFIDEIHTIMYSGKMEGSIDASNILKPYLARNDFKCIGSTTISEYYSTIYKDKALNRRFTPIFINTPTILDTKIIIKSVKKYYEKYHNIKIDDNKVDMIVEMSNKYIKDKNEPDRSLNVLDEICSKINIKNSNKLLTLENKKKEILKSSNYKEAFIIENKINKSKKTYLKICLNDINEYFNDKVSSNYCIGFK